MTFEETLYEAMVKIYPNLTVRSFSGALGMSSGYWSSITAQQLPVSNVALIHLNDYLECRKLVMETDVAHVLKIATVQRMIVKEVVNRFALENEAFEDVWDEISASLRQSSRTSRSNYDAFPFVMLRS
jgi:hypothetical protein